MNVSMRVDTTIATLLTAVDVRLRQWGKYSEPSDQRMHIEDFHPRTPFALGNFFDTAAASDTEGLLAYANSLIYRCCTGNLYHEFRSQFGSTF